MFSWRRPWIRAGAPDGAADGTGQDQVLSCPGLSRALDNVLARETQPRILDLGQPCGSTAVYLADRGARVAVEDFRCGAEGELRIAQEDEGFDLVLALSQRDAMSLRPHLRRAAVETLPVALAPVALENTYQGAPVLVISPNVFNFQGYLFLVDEILKQVLPAFPELEVDVLGDACSFLSPADGVRLLGYRLSLAQHYAEAPFALCPLPTGTGQQVKIDGNQQSAKKHALGKINGQQ